MERNILKNNNFKRLIKSDLLDAQGKEENENYIEISKNPTSNEVEKIKKLNPWNSIRGIIKSGEIYVWNGKFLHTKIDNSILDISDSLHFSYEEGKRDEAWSFDVSNLSTSFKDIYSKLVNSKSVLSQIGDLNQQIFIGATTDNFGYNYEDEKNDPKQSQYFIFKNWTEMEEYVNSINSTTKMSRLASSYITTLHSIILGSGDIISFDVRIVNNKPWYQIAHNHEFYNSNYYDGDDFERAYEMYEELLLAFKRIPEAEKLRKSKNTFQEDINQLFQIKKKDTDNYYTLKRAPSFLGVNGF